MVRQADRSGYWNRCPRRPLGRSDPTPWDGPGPVPPLWNGPRLRSTPMERTPACCSTPMERTRACSIPQERTRDRSTAPTTCRWTDAVTLLRCHWGLLRCAFAGGMRPVTGEHLESRSGRPGLYNSRGEFHPSSYTRIPRSEGWWTSAVAIGWWTSHPLEGSPPSRHSGVPANSITASVRRQGWLSCSGAAPRASAP